MSPKDLVKSENPDRRRRAAVLIGEDRDRRAIPALVVKLSEDPVPIVRAQCAVALGKIGKKKDRVYSALVQSLRNDPASLVKQDALWALGKIGFERAAPVVSHYLKNGTTPDVRYQAAAVLEKIGGEQQYAALIQALKDDVYRVRYQAHQTLRALTGADGPPEPSWWTSELSLP